MFTGWSLHNLDAKGRLAIPARQRDILAARGDERLYVTTGDRCLVAHPLDNWQELTEKVSKMPMFSPQAQAIRRYYISGAVECVPDKQGRILIPPTLREHAGLENQVMLVGMQMTLEIWDKQRWEEERGRIKMEFPDLSATLADMGI